LCSHLDVTPRVRASLQSPDIMESPAIGNDWGLCVYSGLSVHTLKDAERIASLEPLRWVREGQQVA
jgi:hypothetical protein